VGCQGTAAVARRVGCVHGQRCGMAVAVAVAAAVAVAVAVAVAAAVAAMSWVV
jgi:hypothetical protein